MLFIDHQGLALSQVLGAMVDSLVSGLTCKGERVGDVVKTQWPAIMRTEKRLDLYAAALASVHVRIIVHV